MLVTSSHRRTPVPSADRQGSSLFSLDPGFRRDDGVGRDDGGRMQERVAAFGHAAHCLEGKRRNVAGKPLEPPRFPVHLSAGLLRQVVEHRIDLVACAGFVAGDEVVEFLGGETRFH